ncbi:MAG: hypothetical protein V1854_05275 [Methanobacteriota archaeon]
MLDITKMEELLKVNKTQNGQGSAKNEEISLTTTQTSINQIAEPHWFTLITKSGQGGQGYLPDKHIEIILLLGRERKIGIGIGEDLRAILDHLDQSTDINNNMGATDSENRVVRDVLEKPAKTVTKPQKEHNSVTEHEVIEKTPAKNDAKINADFDPKTTQKNDQMKCVTELTPEPKSSNKGIMGRNPDHPDQPRESIRITGTKDIENHLIQDVREKGLIWQGMKGQINSTNVGAFSMWYCDQSGNVHGPTRIKEIASKIFGITPEPPKKDETPEPCNLFTEKNGWVVAQRSAIKVSGEENQIELGDFDDKADGV